MQSEPEYSEKLLSVGTSVGKSYRITELLSRQPGNTIYKAQQIALQKLVALKVLEQKDFEQDAARTQRFLREAKLASSLDHENIVKTLASGFLEDGRPYIVMELIEGVNLRDFLKNREDLTYEKFKSIFAQILDGLSYIHKNALLHRDIKPENILITSFENISTAKLCDFGITKVMDPSEEQQSLTGTKEMLGSPAYMSPEQCSCQKLDERSDLYSLGCVMYEFLAGRPPFTANTAMELMYKQTNESAVPLKKIDPKMPEQISDLVEKCISKEANYRFKNADELKEALSNITLHRASQHNKYKFASLLVLSVLIAFVFTWNQLQRSKTVKCRDVKAPRTEKIALRKRSNVKEEINEDAFKSFNETAAQLDYPQMKLELQRLSSSGLYDKAQLHRCYVYYLIPLSNYPEALEHAKKAAELCQKQEYTKDDYCLERANIEQAFCLTKMNRQKDASVILEKTRAVLSPETQDSFSDAECTLLESSQKYEKLCDVAKHCLKNLQAKSDSNICPLRFRFLVFLCEAYALRKDSDNFLKYAIEAEQILNTEDANTTQTLFSRLAEPYILQKDWQHADALLKREEKNWDKSQLSKDSPNYAKFLQLTALCQLQLGESAKAKENFLKAYQIQERIGDKQVLPSLLGLAYLCGKDSMESDGRKWLQKALSLRENEWSCCDNSRQAFNIYLYLAQEELKFGEREACRRLLEQAKRLPIQTEQERTDCQKLLKLASA